MFTIIAETAKIMAVRLHNSSKSIKAACFSVIGITAIVISLFVSGATMAYRVNYSGRVIATVKNKQQFSAAVSLVSQKVIGGNVAEAMPQPEYTKALVLSSQIDSKDDVAEAIIENTDEIVYASAVTVNGQIVTCVADEVLTDYLNEQLNRYNLENAECKTEFVDSVTVESGYYLKSTLESSEEAKAKIESLAVKTVATVCTDTVIPYSTVTEKTATQPIGYSRVTTDGKEGLNRKVEYVTFVNGVETERYQVSETVISQPVNKVITNGTAKINTSAADRQAAGSAGFIFPLPKGSWQVSAFYGDGRGHKGIDLCAPAGTSIFAVAQGKVTYSGYDGKYGNSIVITHDNGLQTRYAHASSLFAKVGDTVSAGDVIALVGSTGQSTGNHLHIEVIKSGTRVNPAPYIGIN